MTLRKVLAGLLSVALIGARPGVSWAVEAEPPVAAGASKPILASAPPLDQQWYLLRFNALLSAAVPLQKEPERLAAMLAESNAAPKLSPVPRAAGEHLLGALARPEVMPRLIGELKQLQPEQDPDAGVRAAAAVEALARAVHADPAARERLAGALSARSLDPAALLGALYDGGQEIPAEKAAAPGPRRVPLETDNDKLAFLLHAQRHVPGLFEEAATYDTDLFELLENQRTLSLSLRESQDYVASPRWSEPLLRIESSAKGELRIVTKRLNPATLAAWRLRLRETINAHATGVEEHERQMMEAVRGLYAGMRPFSIQGFVTGLINTLPAERRKALFKLPLAQKLAVLDREMPEDIVGRGFDPSQHGLEAAGLDKREALRLLRAEIERRKEFLDAAMPHMILQRHDGVIPGPGYMMHQRAQEAGEAQLDWFLDPQSLAERFRAMLGPLARKDKRTEEILAAIRQDAKRVADAQIATDATLSGTVVLQEMPPDLAILYGFVGGNCATKYSSPYPNSPMERVFFVYDGKGRIKGYAAGTLLEAEGTRAFYAHTISGRDISSADVHLLLQGLQHSRKKLGVERIILPIKERLAALINFVPIRSVLESLIRGKASVRLEYLDKAVRERLDAKVDAKYPYDRADNNLFGVPYAPEAGIADRIAVTSTAAPPEPYKPAQVREEDALLFALDLQYIGKEANAERALAVTQTDSTAFKLLLKALANPLRLQVAQYLNLSVGFHRQGVSRMLSVGELGRLKPYLLEAGWLQAPDAMSEPHAQASITRALRLLKRPRGQSVAGAFIATYRAIFRRNATFMSWVVTALKEGGDSLDTLKRVLEGYAPCCFLRALIPSVLEEAEPLPRLIALLNLRHLDAFDPSLIRAEDPRVSSVLIMGLTQREGTIDILTAALIGAQRLATPEVILALRTAAKTSVTEAILWFRLALLENGVGDMLNVEDSLGLFEWSKYPPGFLLRLSAAMRQNFKLSKEQVFDLFEAKFPEAALINPGLMVEEQQLAALNLLRAVPEADADIVRSLALFQTNGAPNAKLVAAQALKELSQNQAITDPVVRSAIDEALKTSPR